MILIYTPDITPRIEYSCKVLFQTILQAEYRLTSDKDDIRNHSGIGLNYSTEKIQGVFQVIPRGLLSETVIQQHEIKTGEWGGLKTIYHQNEGGNLEFDIFAASFYLLSRYEEYLPTEKDVHGRYKTENSITFKHGFVKVPIVDLWAFQLAKEIGLETPITKDPQAHYSFQLTIDVDHPWKYKNRRWYRILGGLVRVFLTLKWNSFAMQLKVLIGSLRDPNYTFDKILDLNKSLKNKVQFFILTGKFRKYDRGPSLQNRGFRKLIKKLDDENPVGIHPTYHSNKSFKELQRIYFPFTNLLERKITRSRQHYLKMSLPETYHRLIKLGVLHEYSMGWGSATGFRAGIARPFPWYDLTNEKTSHLTLHPFQVMDRTLLSYMQLTPGQAIEEITAIVESVKQVGGEFCALWHNDSVNDVGEWKGWERVFDYLITLHT